MADMTALVQNALENRNLKVVEVEKVPVVQFDLYDQGGEKLGKFYSEIGNDDTEMPVFRATVAPGGVKMFNLETGIEELNSTPSSIVGVVFYARDFNVFFDDDKPKEPPICTSSDAVSGYNRETEETCDCATCPRNKSKNGGRKECRNKVRLYILTQGTPVPLCVDVPPASRTHWSKYKRSMQHFGFLQPHEVLTELYIDTAVDQQGHKYGQVRMRMLGKLDSETVQKVELIQQFFKPEIFEADFEEITNND